MSSLSEMLETRRQAQAEEKRAVQRSRPMNKSGYAQFAETSQSEADYKKDYEKRYTEFQHHNQRMPKGDELDKWYDNHMAEKAKKVSQDFLPGPRQMMEGAAQQRGIKALAEQSLDESMGGKNKKLAMSM